MDGSRRYAAMVEIRDGELVSSCTCPYGLNCKHAVAVVVDYLGRVKNSKPVLMASRNDERLKLLEFDEQEDNGQTRDDEEFVADKTDNKTITDYLQSKTKSELIRLFLEFADLHPGLCMDLLDRQRLERGRPMPCSKDEYSLFEPLVEYLDGSHEKAAWSELADILLKRLKSFQSIRASEFSRDYERDKLSDWAVHVLERADRKSEIIAICEKEARLTASYPRLVDFLISEGRLQDAERWIHEGINTTESKLLGIASELRKRLLTIRRRQKDRRGLAALLVDEFVRMPGEDGFAECKKAAEKLKIWPAERSGLLACLETGKSPWTTPDWPLPKSGTETTESMARSRFPCIEQLIGIAIYEKDPDQVIHWYDKLPKQGLFGHGSIEERVAEAVKDTYLEVLDTLENKPIVKMR